MIRNPKLYTYIGAALGIAGGVLVSFQLVAGFYVWLVGNVAWIIGGIILRDWGIIAQFAFFQLISANGIYQWGK